MWTLLNVAVLLISVPFVASSGTFAWNVRSVVAPWATLIVQLTELAPLHNPAAVAGIDAARARFPGVPQVAAFDTAFHTSMPETIALYPLPWEWTTRWCT